MQSSSAGATPYKGVRDARFVEAPSVMEGVDFSHDVTELPLGEAAIAYDLVVAYACHHANKERSDGEPLNLEKLVDEQASFVGLTREFLINFLSGFVSEHPLKIDGAQLNEWVEDLKHQLVPLARLASLALQKQIAEVTFRAGRQRMDANQIIPAIEGADLALADVKNADDDQELRSRLLMLCATPGAPNPEEPLTDRERHLLKDNKRLETLVEAKVAEIKALRENELRTGFIRITLRSSGTAPDLRHTGYERLKERKDMHKALLMGRPALRTYDSQMESVPHEPTTFV